MPTCLDINQSHNHDQKIKQVLIKKKRICFFRRVWRSSRSQWENISKWVNRQLSGPWQRAENVGEYKGIGDINLYRCTWNSLQDLWKEIRWTGD